MKHSDDAIEISLRGIYSKVIKTDGSKTQQEIYNSLALKMINLIEKHWILHSNMERVDYAITFIISSELRDHYREFIEFLTEPEKLTQYLNGASDHEMMNLIIDLQNEKKSFSIMKSPSGFISNSLKHKSGFKIRTYGLMTRIVWLCLVNVFLRNHKVFLSNMNSVCEIDIPIPISQYI